MSVQRGDFGTALCLVAVIEGLILFAAPRGWQRMAAEAQKMPPQRLRLVGAVAIALGLIGLQLLRH